MVMTTEDKSRESMARSNALFEKALGLLDKESSGDINEVTITNYIATNYLSVGETEKALEIFKRNNIHNMNSSLISYLYAIELNQPDESLKYAKKTIIDMVISLSRTIYGISFAYASRNDRACITSLKWLASFLDTLKTDPDAMVYTDKFKILSLALCAVWEEMFGYPKDAKKDIEEAYALACEFDASPVFDAHGIRFIDDPEGKLIDSFGKDVSEAVEKYVFELVPENKASAKIKKKWAELRTN
jgi:tetratricopeptide (TPR) repeat protein